MRRSLGLITLITLATLCLTGCSRYVSSYSAVAFVHSNVSDSAFMSFHSFEGRMVFRLKSGESGYLKYSAKLDAGSASVYYDRGGTKEELFSIGPGGEADSSLGPLEKGTVYVIVETDGKCRGGSFRFDMEQAAAEDRR